ncbi:MAG: PorP/SprF family type IX secretion system membrane protein [Saprospiraceae bacterium]|nr:PorP/SprF family type IX secretion system membrane protein [Saprospiraceae bacterium]
MRQIIIAILACGALAMQAQQTPQYSLYALNPYAFNPAYAGLENTLIANGVYRQQWSGLEGAPVTQHLNAHMPLYAISSGVGIRVENDVIGAHQISQGALSYNYQLQAGKNTLISLGVSVGFFQYVLDGSKLRAPQGSYIDPDFNHNDLLLPYGKERAGAPFVEAGVFAQINKFSLGASFQPVYAPTISNDLGVNPLPHGYFYAGYDLGVGENLNLKSALLVKSDLIKTQAEISFLAQWRQNIFAGASYRGFGTTSKDAAVLMAGLKLNDKTTLAYAFDVPLSALNTVNRGSHELMLRYSLNKPIGVGTLPPIIYNPRFF